jgi:hypothetical protein
MQGRKTVSFQQQEAPKSAPKSAPFTETRPVSQQPAASPATLATDLSKQVGTVAGGTGKNWISGTYWSGWRRFSPGF